MSTQSVIYTKQLTERGETDVLKEKIFVYLIIVPPFTRRIDKNGVLVMSSKKVVEMLCQTCEDIGFVETLHNIFGNNIKVSIPFSKTSRDTSINELDFFGSCFELSP